MRKIKFANNEYYHVYNRGVDKRKIFMDENDFHRFYLSLDLLNDERDGLMEEWSNYKRSRPRAQVSEFMKKIGSRKKLVDILAYSLNLNHYHILMRQKRESGIERFMHKIGTSYTNYFNKRYDRTGALFQGRFKSAHIKSNDKLLYLSVYVNCNIEVHGHGNASGYKWCSFPSYLGKKSGDIVKKELVMKQFRNVNEYRDFSRDNVKAMKIKKADEKIMLE
jgi:putative transposase